MTTMTPGPAFRGRDDVSDRHDPAAWLVVLLSLVIVVVALGAVVTGLAVTGELPFAQSACGCTPTAGEVTP